MTSRTATLIGFSAILMWSLLAVLTVATGTMPAFQLAAITFAIGGLVGLSTFIRRPEALSALRQPPAVWAVGVGGLFGYHALYFLALRFAPPAEAGLLNYLWPLLIVLFSSLLPGERLLAHHVIGALAGLCRHGVAAGWQRPVWFCARTASRSLRRFHRGLRLGELFGDVAPAQICADRSGGRILPRHCAARRGDA